ncbi:hypothetical protein [Vibrio europaeus]|uniref:hypothetical protein n=1 Tax=Vibrio europaeus TaxID=300876 RepID=UPI00148E6632|nr:hypothetical protein [Vibrio europaeus]MDC5839397.1 hypothetical protein [Vibrio europaeus]NOH23669.1 hypothetical protein [Vibrio europaeus]
MKKILTPLTFAIAISFTGLTNAQDFVPQSATSEGLEAQQQVASEPYKQKEIVEYVSAEQQIRDYMEARGWPEGWDKNKKRLFVLSQEQFDSEDPSYDDSFVIKRSQFATLATMSAKAQMVEYMRTTMSAVDMLVAPGTDVHAELNERYTKAEKKLAAQKKQLVKILSELDQAEADKISGTTWEDRAEATWDGVIKRIDDSYDTAELEEAKRQKYEKVKQRYEEASAELETIEAEANKLASEVKLESTSMVETLAQAPILGASVLVQAESWNAEREVYEVATLLVWSPKLEAAAKAVITGEPITLKPKDGMTAQAWLKAQEASTMVGPRQFVDNEGERWFIGAYAMPVAGPSSLVRKNRKLAESMAQKEMAVAVFADIETQKQAAIAMQTRSTELGKKDSTEVATSFSEATRQSVQNRTINGMSKLFSTTIVHPISQQEMYVVAYGVSASSASEALAIEYSSFDAAAVANRHNNLKGVQGAQNQAKLNRSKSETAVASVDSFDSTPVVSAPKVENVQPSTPSKTLISTPAISDDDF